jgi:tRNA modification GTPase
MIDEGLVLWLPAPGSYTGEDSFELHLHGGPAIVRACQDALHGLGLRLAEPGEFTRRAFQSGRLDLSQAEAVADLVDAETEAQRRQALDQLGGGLSRRYAAWRTELVESLALLEAEIDFPDEDLPDALSRRVGARVRALAGELDAALADAARGERVRDGYRVALIGAPNAGKSTLFNALLERDAAIVTPIAGTTRDVLEAGLVMDGYKVLLADTAGVRPTDDAIEAEGVRRARAWADDAALRLWVVDASGGEAAWREGADLLRPGDLLVLSKGDLAEGPAAAAARSVARETSLSVLTVSAPAVDGLREALRERVAAALGGAEFPSATRARHRARLEEALGALRRADAALAFGPELAAEDLRLAANALGRVAGRIDAEDVLDVVFASFCIGK